MGVWKWNGVDICQVANGGRYAVTDLYDEGWFRLANEDPRVLSRVGRPWVLKWPDVRRVGLGVIVWGKDSQEFEQRLYNLRGLIGYTPGTLRHELFDGRVLEIRAELERMEISTKGPMTARMALEFRSVDDPFFRDITPVVTNATITTTTAPFQVDFTHSNPGLEDRGMVIRFQGPATNPTLWNLTADPDLGMYLGYQGALGTNDTVDFYVREFRAILNGSTDVSNNVVHSGDKYWFVLLSGDNILRFGAEDSGGLVTITQYPPY